MKKTLQGSAGAGPTALFVLSVFLSAFLLFQVQPIIARFILPWYGGSPSVWSTCMLFFQVGLVVGYAYAHALVTLFRNRRPIQIGVHFLLVLAAIAFLPMTPDPGLKPQSGDADPVVGILTLLAKTVGLPYVVLSASGPLIQHWFSRVWPGRSPYRLYAVSNAGSLLALLSYPFFFEVHFAVSRQSVLWSVAFVSYAIVLLAVSIVFVRFVRPETAAASEAKDDGVEPKTGHWARWLLFSACGSILLLSVTSRICQDVAVVPFLWILPLSVYLLSFIIAFDHSRWYRRIVAVPLTMVAVGLVVVLLNESFESGSWSFVTQIAIYSAALFLACLVCHGEIVRLKPKAKYLTGFYLAISVGGALGGVFVSLVAPRVFDDYYELELGLVLLAILLSWQLCPGFLAGFRRSTGEGKGAVRLVIASMGAIGWVSAVAGMITAIVLYWTTEQRVVIKSARGFFGVLKVEEKQAKTGQTYRILVHGKIDHGLQVKDELLATLPTTYFTESSGIGAVFGCRSQLGGDTRPLKVGIIGLGVGTLAAYAQERDSFRFYEIDPLVTNMAKEYFTYLEDCQGDLEVVEGDARISLENELQESGGNDFDLFVVDAFSGDSIPMHLLTLEAIELYLKHLKPTGVLAIHITNKHIDLTDPIRVISRKLKWSPLRMDSNLRVGLSYTSEWLALTRNLPVAETLLEAKRLHAWEREEPKELMWTDDFHSLFPALK